MARIAIVYHSGYGHTQKVAEYVEQGASLDGVEVSRLSVDDFEDAEAGPWDVLAAADAIVFGAPTYMGTASAAMNRFLELTSKIWFTAGWQDKLAAGFTNSGSLAGDKNETLQRFATLAGQQGMIWINFGMKSGYNATSSNFAEAQNRAGHYLGLGTQALTDQGADEAPDAADLATAELFGRRIAEVTLRWVKGGG